MESGWRANAKPACVSSTQTVPGVLLSCHSNEAEPTSFQVHARCVCVCVCVCFAVYLYFVGNALMLSDFILVYINLTEKRATEEEGR